MKKIRNSILLLMAFVGFNCYWIAFVCECYARLWRWVQFGDYSILRGVMFETIETCNRKCSYCPVKDMPLRTGRMSEELFEKITDELRDIGFNGDIYFMFYNEPLLDKRLPWFVETSKRKLPNSIHQVYSNGDFLDMEAYMKLDLAGVDSISVTDHDNIPDAYTKFRDMPKVMFQHSKDLHFLNNRGGLVDVKQPHLGRVFLWLYKLFIGGCFQSAVPVIGYNGVVYLCCQDALKSTNLGNLSKESFISIMERSRSMRKTTMSGKFSLKMCKKCREIYGGFTNTRYP